jgi:stress response protein SCP2
MALSVEVKKGSSMQVLTKALNIGIITDLSWDPADAGSPACDADLFVAVTANNGGTYYMTDMASLIYHANTSGFGGVVSHSGDEQKGAKDGADESVTAFLNKLPANTTDFFIGVCVDPVKSPGVKFSDVKNLTLKVRQLTEGSQTPEEKCFANLTSSANGIIIGKFTKSDSGWDFTNINQDVLCTSKTPIVEVLQACPIDSLA